MNRLLESEFSSFEELHNIIKDFIDKQKKEDILIMESDYYTEDDVDELANEYDIYYDKLKYIKTLEDDKKNANEHLEMFFQIDNLNYLSRKEKMKNIFSYIVLVQKLESFDKYTFDQLLLLSTSLNLTAADEYEYYLYIFKNKNVLDSIMLVEEGLFRRNILAKNIIKEIDENKYAKDEQLIDIALNVIRDSRELSK